MRVTKDHNNSNKNRVQIKKKKGDKQLRHKSTSVAIVVVPVVPVVFIVIIWSLLLLLCCCCCCWWWWYYWFWVNNRITCTYVSSIHICTQSLSHIPTHTHPHSLTHKQSPTKHTHIHTLREHFRFMSDDCGRLQMNDKRWNYESWSICGPPRIL